MVDDGYRDGQIQDSLEFEALALGGQAFLDDVHGEAGAHVDAHHPWDGRGDEPMERVAAYLAALWERVEVERAGRHLSDRPRPAGETMMPSMAVTRYDTSCSVTYLAHRLGLDAADVEVVMRWLDIVAVADRITGRESAEVAALLDPHYSRRVPELFGQADLDWRDDRPVQRHGLGSPTGEGPAGAR